MSEYTEAQLREKYLPKRAALYAEALTVGDVVRFLKDPSISRDARVHTELDDLGRTALVAEWQIPNPRAYLLRLGDVVRDIWGGAR